MISGSLMIKNDRNRFLLQKVMHPYHDKKVYVERFHPGIKSVVKMSTARGMGVLLAMVLE